MMSLKDREMVSLRSIEEGSDVSKVAEFYGGGGHTGAASFKKNKLFVNIEDLKYAHK